MPEPHWGSKKQNKAEILLLAGDLMLLKNHLKKKMADLSTILNEWEETQTAAGHWSSLPKTTLARIIIFNKEDQERLPPYNYCKCRPNWASCSGLPWGERGNRGTNMPTKEEERISFL